MGAVPAAVPAEGTERVGRPGRRAPGGPGRFSRRILAAPVALVLALGALTALAGPAGASSVAGVGACLGDWAVSGGCTIAFGGTTTGTAGQGGVHYAVAFTATTALTSSDYVTISGLGSAAGIRFPSNRTDNYGYGIRTGTTTIGCGLFHTGDPQTVTLFNTGQTVEVPVPTDCQTKSGASIIIQIPNVTNPSTAGTKHLSVSTSVNSPSVMTNALTMLSVPARRPR